MNNMQIDNTSYYLLPCGLQLEDFIAHRRLDFFWGSALKYVWRAGNKDGETKAKDMAKALHYCRLIARRLEEPANDVMRRVELLKDRAMQWDGKGWE